MKVCSLFQQLGVCDHLAAAPAASVIGYKCCLAFGGLPFASLSHLFSVCCALCAARRWLNSAVQQPLSPSSAVKAADVICTPREARQLTKKEINDRFQQHTQHCTICQKAMKKFERMAQVAAACAVALGAAVVALLSGVWLPLWLSSAGGNGAAAGAAAASSSVCSWLTVLCGVGAAAAAAVARFAGTKMQQFVYVEYSHADNH